MKADQSLTNLFRQLRPVLCHPHSGLSRIRPTFCTAAFNRPTVSQRPFAPGSQHHHPTSSFQNRRHFTYPPAPSSVPTSTTKSQSVPNQTPAYEITFTCKPCKHRSAHRVSKRGYNHGTVLITCPSCKNRHVFADHLKIIADKSFTIEDLMREKGQLVKRGTLEGDLEFWDDGTKIERAKD